MSLRMSSEYNNYKDTATMDIEPYLMTYKFGKIALHEYVNLSLLHSKCFLITKILINAAKII